MRAASPRPSTTVVSSLVAVTLLARPRSFSVKLESVTLNDLGRASKVTATKDDTTVVEGRGDAARIKGRIEEIKVEIDKSTSDYDKEKLQERLAKLSGGGAVIRV